MLARIRRPGAVYPRWRGEHGSKSNAVQLYAGLSPLARGTLVDGFPPVFAIRFIPAGAGNTSPAFHLRVIRAVYPRWRGEHPLRESRCGFNIGLSPLARGTRTRSPASRISRRFIPAGAGNTQHTPCGGSVRPVYPRWRGEHCPAMPLVLRPAGLSPLARGTRVTIFECHRTNRFIPAGAGNTANVSNMKCLWPVYPRWRGEHVHINI